VGDACPPLSSKVCGKAGLERCGAARLGRVRCSKARQVWLGMVLCDAVRNGFVRYGKAGEVWRGVVRYGSARLGGGSFGKAGGARHGSMRFDSVWSVMVRQVWLVKARLGIARFGSVRQVRRR
jgi:hypothetical protein